MPDNNDKSAPDSKGDQNKRARLTDRQRQIVHLDLIGKSLQESSEILGVNFHTVRSARSRLHKKLGVPNSIAFAAREWGITAEEIVIPLFSELTLIEFQVAALAALGNTNKQIADELGITYTQTKYSPPGIKNALARVMDKFGASNRQEVAWMVLDRVIAARPEKTEKRIDIDIKISNELLPNRKRKSRRRKRKRAQVKPAAQVKPVSVKPRRKSTLPPRPQQVLELALQGKSRKEMAAALGVGPETVKAYIKKIYKTFGTSNLIKCAALAWNITAKEITQPMFPTLSPAELETVALATLGNADNEIAQEMKITEANVKENLQTAGMKLGVTGHKQIAYIVRDAVRAKRANQPPTPRAEIESKLPRWHRPRPPPQQQTGILAPRQQEVLDLALQGMSAVESEEQLRLSPGVVDKYRRTVFRKLGVRNAEEYAAREWKITAEEITAAAPSTLSPKELAVVTPITLGKYQMEIARELEISDRTVHARLKQAANKLGVSDYRKIAHAIREIVLDARKPRVDRPFDTDPAAADGRLGAFIPN